MTTSVPPDPPLRPELGDSLYLDGFWYVMGFSAKRPGSDGRLHITRSFCRPDVLNIRVALAKRSAVKQTDEYRALTSTGQREAALDAAALMPTKNEAWQKNFNYKAEGETLEEHLRWLTWEQLIAGLEEQKDLLVAGGGKASRLWARATFTNQRAELALRVTSNPTGGCWVVAEEREDPAHGGQWGWRLLAKPPIVRLQHLETKQTSEMPVYVADATDADKLAVAVLGSHDVPQLVASGLASWKPAAGHQIVRW